MGEPSSYLLVFDHADVHTLRETVQRILETITEITVELGEITQSETGIQITATVMNSHPLEATLLYRTLESIDEFRHVQRT